MISVIPLYRSGTHACADEWTVHGNEPTAYQCPPVLACPAEAEGPCPFRGAACGVRGPLREPSGPALAPARCGERAPPSPRIPRIPARAEPGAAVCAGR